MTSSRRQFIAISTMGAVATALPLHAEQEPAAAQNQPTPGAPPAFGTAPPVGPEVSAATFAEAEKLVQIKMSEADRAQAAGNWQRAMAPLYERRNGPRKMTLEPSVAPATVWNPMLPGISLENASTGAHHFLRSPDPHAPLPSNEAEIAFASIAQLSRWIESKQITSERLTNIYLDRLQRFDPTLRCVITLTRDHALAQARQAD